MPHFALRSAIAGPAPRVQLDEATLCIAAGLLVACGLAHASITPAHFTEWWGYGLMFALAGVAQLGLGVVIVSTRDERALRAAVLVATIAIVAWVLSRTVGLPLAPGRRLGETAGALDLLTVVAEGLTLALLVGMPRGLLSRGGLGASHAAGAVLIALLAVAFAAGVGHD